ncbi:hypothetical protein [Nocardioides sp. LHG3406-4]|uniref:hypothetical protein n=1 Tax=Nocardioides sp. LHG3406-4 TaxID=2804575 RepID=UPI003CEE9D88
MKRLHGGARMWLMRAVVTAAPVAAVLLTATVGEGPGTVLLVVLTVLAGGWAVFPESAVGVVVLALVVAWWAIGLEGDQALHPVVVAAAGCLVLAHVTALLSSYAPAEVGVPRALVLTWVRRGLAVLLPVPALLVVARLLRGDADVAGVWTAGLVGVMVATVLCALAVRGLRESSS